MSAETPGGSPSYETDFAAMWSSDGVTRSFAPTATGLPADLPFLFTAGQQLGAYRIIRPIGKGGMGQVYEADEIESGRRVAVKILSRGLGDEEERARFLREGQLTASLSHPNCVYVFGTSEVQGFPVIAMELAPAGTLKDLVVPGTPLAPAVAVDAVLQVVTGLEAAASLGILHRDIKPSNCFVDRDGRVMVGDFGLSIATLARDEHTLAVAGTILGTPGFASPEQLRGGALDIRSDIYSVGATLYYLLTGGAPFDDPNIVTLITRVATEPPPPLSVARPDVTTRLGSVVARCLAKQPGERYASYAALASALEPFRSASLTPAPLGRRFLSGVIDTYAAALPVIPINLYLGVRFLYSQHLTMVMAATLPGVLVSIAYYTILEGRFGCGAGKAVFNLRVIDRAEAAPGFRRACARVMLLILPGQVANVAIGALLMPLAERSSGAPGNLTSSLLALVNVAISLLCFGVLFSTVRRRNGYAALHDLATATRVVLRPKAIEARLAGPRVSSAVVRPEAWDARIGPYVVASDVKAMAAGVDAACVVEGYDDRLRRRVWIELLPAGAAPLPAQRRDLGRPTRTRWLSGRRADGECWDAYEAVDGQTLVEAIARPQPWARVRHWVADLAREIAMASKDGSLPVLAVDRIWIGSDDRVRLLDWPAPGSRIGGGLSPAPDRSPSSADLAAAQRFIYGIAAGALRGMDPAAAGQAPPAIPLPVAARALLLSLRDGAMATVEALDREASALLRSPAAFPRSRRAIQVGVCALLPVLLPVAVLLTILSQQRAQLADPSAFQFKTGVQRLAALEKRGPALTATEREERDAVEIYIAEHLQKAVDESAVYASNIGAVNNIRKEHELAALAVAHHPRRTPEQVQRADAVMAQLVASQSRSLGALTHPMILWGMTVFIAAWSAALVAIFALIGALAARGGLTLRAFGGALVTKDGARASRLRAMWRAVVTWSPVLVALLLIRVGPAVQQASAGSALLQTLALAPLAAGAVWALMRPARAIQDRLAGTWLVPR